MAGIGIAGLFILCPASNSNDPSDNYTYQLTQFDKAVIGWQLGDDIFPYPPGGFDCDDETLYSYLYLLGLHRNYEVKIMKGLSPYNHSVYHVWLEVSDNQSRYIYDWGMARNDFFVFNGTQITYRQLLNYAIADQ
jgi:hypothetical protein